MAQNRDSVSVANNPGDGDLHARLLAEIERREGDNVLARTVNAKFHHPPDVADVRAYLAALRGVVELHAERAGDCSECGDQTVYYPCATLRCVAEGIGVEVDG